MLSALGIIADNRNLGEKMRKVWKVIVSEKRLLHRVAISLIIVTFGIGVVAGFRAVYAAPAQKTQFDSGVSCTNRYNAKLMEAKSALIKGDRASALAALVAARDQLARCQDREEDSATHAVAVSLNMLNLSDSSGLI